MIGSMSPVGRMICSATDPPASGLPGSPRYHPGALQLVGPRRRGDVEGLRDETGELREGERPVVEGRGQAEAVLDERLLARAVARVHAADLRRGHVRLVEDDQRVLREVVHQGRRVLSRLAPGEVPRVVLDPVAVAELAQHLHVEERALLEALRLQQPAARLEEAEPLAQLVHDALDRALELGGRGHVVARGVDPRVPHRAGGDPAEGIDGHQPLDAVAPELHPQRLRFGGGRKHLDHVAPHPEGAAAEVVVVALVLHRDQGPDEGVPVHGLARPQRHVHAVVGLGLADAVDAGHRGDHHHVAALEERRGRRVPHAVDLVVHQRVLLDVGVRLRDVGFRLIIVVVGHEVLDRARREERLELAVQLGGQRLVGRDHQRGPAEPRDQVGEREGLAAAGDPQQDGVGTPRPDDRDQALDRLRLIPGRSELRGEREQRLRQLVAQRDLRTSRAPPPGTSATSRGTRSRADAGAGAPRRGIAGARAPGSAAAAPRPACGCP